MIGRFKEVDVHGKVTVFVGSASGQLWKTLIMSV